MRDRNIKQPVNQPRKKLISVIIPTYNEEVALPHALSQFETLNGCWELVIADSGSSDRSLAIARRSGATVIEDAPSGRGAAMNAGAAVAMGDILLFLHADTLLPADAYEQITAELACPGVAATGFRLKMDRDLWRYRMLSHIATFRFRVQRTFFGDQAIAVRRQDFEQIGGYREPLLMEDVDLSRRLRRRARLKLLSSQVTTSARRFEKGGIVRTLAFMTFLQLAYAFGVSAKRLNSGYRHTRSTPEPPPKQPERLRAATRWLAEEAD